MHLWIKKISAQLDCHLRTGGRDTDEWIWDTMINDFTQNFQDVMSRERAEKKLFELQMEKGELDEYTSQFQQLAKLARYYEQTGMICRRYFQGLPQGLQESMIAFEPTHHYQTLEDWIEGVLRYCRNVRPTWVKFNSKDTKESGLVCEGFRVLSPRRGLR